MSWHRRLKHYENFLRGLALGVCVGFILAGLLVACIERRGSHVENPNRAEAKRLAEAYERIQR